MCPDGKQLWKHFGKFCRILNNCYHGLEPRSVRLIKNKQFERLKVGYFSSSGVFLPSLFHSIVIPLHNSFLPPFLKLLYSPSMLHSLPHQCPCEGTSGICAIFAVCFHPSIPQPRATGAGRLTCVSLVERARAQVSLKVGIGSMKADRSYVWRGLN